MRCQVGRLCAVLLFPRLLPVQICHIVACMDHVKCPQVAEQDSVPAPQRFNQVVVKQLSFFLPSCVLRVWTSDVCKFSGRFWVHCVPAASDLKHAIIAALDCCSSVGCREEQQSAVNGSISVGLSY